MSRQLQRFRNTQVVIDLASGSYARAISAGLMQVTLESRDGRHVVLPGGQRVVEFVNCSYLGLDTRPEVIAGGQATLDTWGVHLCCARSRFSIGPLAELEAGLSELWGGRAVTFPTVTAAHMSTMPLLGSEAFGGHSAGTVFLYDRLAHASMRYLQPILAVEHEVQTLPHNDLDALRAAVRSAQANGKHVVYVADGVYSMGGVCPIDQVLALSRELGFSLYIDDAHGTSILGARGEGSVVSRLGGRLPENVTVAFSLAKGFGCNGGGVLLPTEAAERHVRTFGTSYAFSAPLDFSVVGAALAVLQLHRDGTVRSLQQALRQRVATFDAALGRHPEAFSPIRMIDIGDESRAIDIAEQLKSRGFFVTVAFFPVVGRSAAQLRISIGVGHSADELRGLAAALRDTGGL